MPTKRAECNCFTVEVLEEHGGAADDVPYILFTILCCNRREREINISSFSILNFSFKRPSFSVLLDFITENFQIYFLFFHSSFQFLLYSLYIVVYYNVGYYTFADYFIIYVFHIIYHRNHNKIWMNSWMHELCMANEYSLFWWSYKYLR